MNGFRSLLLILSVCQAGATYAQFGSGDSRPSLPPNRSPQAAAGLPPATALPPGVGGSQAAQTAGQSLVEDGNRRSFGWTLDSTRDNELYYIIQVSPSEVLQMVAEQERNTGFFSEKSTDMPKELVGRVSRVVWRIGEKELPRNPSLAEIATWPRIDGSGSSLQAAIDGFGPGNLANVEGSQSALPIQRPLPNNSTPPSISPNGSTFPPSGRTFQPNSGASSQLGNNTTTPPSFGTGFPAGSVADSFLGDTRGSANPANPAASPVLPNVGGNGMSDISPPQNPIRPGLTADARNNPASGLPPYGPGYSQSNPSRFDSPDPPSMSTSTGGSGFAGQSTPAPGFGTSPGQWTGSNNNTFTTDPNRQAANQGAQGMAGSHTGGGNVYPNGTGAAGGFNDQYPEQPQRPASGFGQGQGYAGQSYTGQNYPPRQFPPTPGAGAGDDRILLADATGSVGARPPAEDSSPSKRSPKQNDDGRDSESESDKQTQAADSMMPFLLLFSLVVNVYLGMLIRKLLGRYRTVLSNVRNQTA